MFEGGECWQWGIVGQGAAGRALVWFWLSCHTVHVTHGILAASTGSQAAGTQNKCWVCSVCCVGMQSKVATGTQVQARGCSSLLITPSCGAWQAVSVEAVLACTKVLLHGMCHRVCSCWGCCHEMASGCMMPAPVCRSCIVWQGLWCLSVRLWH